MDDKLQELIFEVSSHLTPGDLKISHIFDLRRFAKMAHYAWINEIGFHPSMFKESLKKAELFSSIPEDTLEDMALQLCIQADFAKSMFHAAFDIEKLPIK